MEFIYMLIYTFFQFETRRDLGVALLGIGQLDLHQDPRTQDADKYFLGDRFHEKTVTI